MNRRNSEQLEKRRLEGYRLLQAGDEPSAVARRLGVSAAAVSKWKRQAMRRGAAALKSKGPPGPKARLSAAQKECLRRALLQGALAHGWENDLWTLRRVAHLVRRLFRLHYHRGHLWRVLQGMGFSCQRPSGRARERDEAAIRMWRRDVWPALKKSPARRPHHRIP